MNQVIADGYKEEEESISDLEGRQDKVVAFNVPLSVFHYKGYDSDFFTSWYSVSSRIFKEINTCPEKKILNLALSTLMLPYIAFAALGLVIYSRFETNKASLGKSKTKKSEVSESMPKRLAYGVLTAVVIFVNIAMLVALFIPGTLALATFYLLNRKLSHSLVAALKISSESCQSKCQSIKVSFHETEVDKPNIMWGVEIKFPPQFKQLLENLYGDEDDRWFDVIRDPEHNTILKLSANIRLENGLKLLHSEIRNVLATSIQEFAKAMEKLMKVEKQGITYDKLKESLNKFRSKVVSSIDSKLATHLICNAYQVAFVQAIKFQRDRRGKDFLLEDKLKNSLVKQELESQGKELPSEKEMIIRDLRAAGAKVPDVLDDSEFPIFKAKWEQFIQEGKIIKKAIIDAYKDIYLQETEKALDNAKEEIKLLKEGGQKRYTRIHEKLKEMYKDVGKNSLTDSALKRKLEGLFKFEYSDQEVERRLVKSVIKRAESKLSQSDIPDEEKQSLGKQLEGLEKEASAKMNDLIEKIYLEVMKCKMQNLFNSQAKGIEDSCKLLEQEAPDLAKRINLHRMRIEKYLKKPEQPILLKKIIEGNKDLNEYLENERSKKGKEHPNTKLIQKHLENNQEILKALKQLELEKEGLLINEEAKNNYRGKLESYEKIKFAIIEDDLLKAFEHEIFDEEAIKKLLEEAELEYYLAEKYMRNPVIKMKNNVKHFCQDLLSPLINRLVENIVNNIPKSNKSSWIQPMKTFQISWGYIKTGFAAAMYGNESTEGKTLNIAHNTYKEGETFLQHFQSNCEGFGDFLGNLFSDDGETFKNDVWPKVEKHLHGMWDRFFKNIEFTLISGGKNINEGAVGTKLDRSTIQIHSNVDNLIAAGRNTLSVSV